MAQRFPRRPTVPAALVAGLILAPAVLAIISPAAARDDEAKKDDEKEEPVDPARELGVRLDEAPELEVALGRAETALREGEWDRAAVILSQAAAKHRGAVRLVPSKSKRVVLYESAGRLIRRHLAELSPDAVAAFDRRFATEAERVVERALQDPGTASLRRVADVFFPTESGARALFEAGSRHLERGDHIRAREVWTELFRHHHDALWRRRAALGCLGLLAADGETASLERFAAEVADSPIGGQRVSFEGALVSIDDVARALIAGRGIPSGGVAPATAPELLVDAAGAVVRPDRTAKVVVPARPTATKPLWDAPLPEGELLAKVAELFRPGVVATEDLAIVHLGRSLFAYSLVDGSDRWTINGYRGLRRHLENVAVSAVPQPPHGLAIDRTRGILYATMSAQVSMANNPMMGAAVKYDAASANVVAVELRTGKRRWQQSLEVDESGLVAAGAPVLVGDVVIVGAFAADSPEEAWVLALSAETGEIVWHRFVGATLPDRYRSRNNAAMARARVMMGAAGVNAGGPMVPPVPTIAARGDSIAISSNGGVLGVLDATDGGVRWLRVYEPSSSRRPEDIAIVLQKRNRRVPRAIAEAPVEPIVRNRRFAPPVWLGDRIVFAPDDLDHLTLADAASGRPVGRSLAHRGRLTAVVGGRVIVVGEQAIDAFALKGLKLTWVYPKRTAAGAKQKLEVAGRPTLAGDHLLVPSDGGILAFGLDGAGPKTLLTFSDAKEQAGSIALVRANAGGRRARMILTASSRRVQAFALPGE